ncbi:hypothetical protein ACFL2F_05400, partial [Myxococcota bacterium]
MSIQLKLILGEDAEAGLPDHHAGDALLGRVQVNLLDGTHDAPLVERDHLHPLDFMQLPDHRASLFAPRLLTLGLSLGGFLRLTDDLDLGG